MDQKPKDELMAYFMGQTNERLMAIETKLVELISFRAEVLSTAKADAKNTAVWVSLVTAIIMIVVNVGLKKMGLM